MKKAILSIMLLVTIIMNTLGVNAADQKRFSDIQDNYWANQNIDHLVSIQVINGFPDGTFKPNFSINIDSFIKMTVTALGYTNIKNDAVYWAKNYIDKALELELITEDQFLTYRKPITREEMSSIIVKAIKDEKKADTREFVEKHVKDFSSTSYRYKEDVKDAYSLGIITGLPDGTFMPNNESTRAEASAIIHRLLDTKQRKPFEIPTPDTSNDNNSNTGTDSGNDNSNNNNGNGGVDPDTPIEYIHKVENDKVVYSSEKIMKILKEYPVRENDFNNDFYENNRLCTDQEHELEKYGSLSKETVKFVETFFTRDYTTLDKEVELNKLLWWFQAWWMYRNVEYAPKDFVKLWLDETEKWKVQQDMIFVTDSYRMIYGFNHGKAVRGRMYFKFDSHSNIENIKYEFELPESMEDPFKNLQFGKWYYVDVDVLMFNPASNAPVTWATAKYTLYTYHYLSDFKIVEGQ